jgi:2-hydroxyglutarate dehydrogenase
MQGLQYSLLERNSIGLHYPPNSLKTILCLRGRDLLYQYCRENSVPHKKIGKLVVGLPHQQAYLSSLHKHCQSLSISWPPNGSTTSKLECPSELIGGTAARDLEPDLSRDIDGALWSPETGIVDSHSFMESLEKEITDSDGAGELVYGTKVVRVDASDEGWVIQLVTGESQEGDAVLAKVLINASGLSSTQIINSLLPPNSPDRLPMYFARGSYASYRGPGIGSISHLIYPVPESGGQGKGKQAHTNESLGTHLTLDLEGNVRFGPDIQWISPQSEDDAEFCKEHLIPTSDRMESMYEAITTYLPNISLGGLQPDYVGIRPKLGGPGSGFHDFKIRVDESGMTKRRKGEGKMITLLGIESPGLTSSLAIAELVVDEIMPRKE